MAKLDIAVRSLRKNGAQVHGELKFIIAATDGRELELEVPRSVTNTYRYLAVWDSISSDEALGLVATHLEHPKHSPIPREAVQDELIIQNRASRERHPGSRPKDEGLKGDWVYEDDNAATHLVRNAFGTSRAVDTAYELLSIPNPESRRWRDDVTCS